MSGSARESVLLSYSEVFGFETSSFKSSRIYPIDSDSSIRTLHDVKFPEKCGGFCYSDSSYNRFFTWRSSGNTLELQEDSLDVILKSGFIKLVFSNSAVVNCVLSDTSGEVDVLVCTSNSAARFTFYHPSRLRKTSSSNVMYSIFHGEELCKSTFPLRSIQPNQLKCASACVRSSDHHAIFAFGMTSGSVLLVDMPNLGSQEPTIMFELHQSSIIQKLWSGIIPFSGRADTHAADLVTDLCFVDSAGLLFLVAVCRDHKLRVWNVNTREYMLAINLLEYLPDTPAGNQVAMRSGHGHRIKPLFDSNSNRQRHVKDHTDRLLVLLNFCAQSYWILVEISAQSAAQYPREFVQPVHTQKLQSPVNVMDFAPVFIPKENKRSLGVWSISCGEDHDSSAYSLKLTDFDDGIIDTVALLESPFWRNYSRLPAILKHEDAQEVVLNELFTPGKVPKIAIINSIKSVRRSLKMKESECPFTMEELQIELIKLMEDKISNALQFDQAGYGEFSTMEHSHYEAQPTRPQVIRHNEWENFYSIVIDHMELSCRPVGLLALSQPGVCLGLVRRWGVSLLRPLQTIEKLEHCSSYPEVSVLVGRAQDPLLLRHNLQDEGNCRELFMVLKLCHKIMEYLQEKNMFREITFKIMDMREDPSYLMMDLCRELLSNDETIERSIRETVAESENLMISLEVLLDILERLNQLPDNEELFDEGYLHEMLRNMTVDHVRGAGFVSPLAGELICQGVLQNTKSRLHLSLAFLLFSTYLFRESDMIVNYPEPEVHLEGTIICRLSGLIRSLLVILWTCETRLNKNLPPSYIASVHQKLRILGLQVDNVNPDSLDSGDTGSSSIIEEFYSNVRHLHLNRPTLWSDGASNAITKLQQGMTPIPGTQAVIALARYLLVNAQFMELSNYCRLLSTPDDWWMGDILLVRFISAISLLFLGEISKAVDQFNIAIASLSNLENLSDTQLLDLVNEDQSVMLHEMTLPEIQGHLFLKVMNLVESVEEPVYVIRLAHYALDLLKPALPDYIRQGYHSNTDRENDMDTEDDSDLRLVQLWSVFWTRIFKHELDVENSVNAFQAIVENPDPQQQRDRLRQLIIRLCERGDLQTLIEFQYNELESEFVSIVRSRARCTDISVYNYYELLYAFHISNKSFSEAAQCMHEQAIRLRHECPPLLPDNQSASIPPSHNSPKSLFQLPNTSITSANLLKENDILVNREVALLQLKQQGRCLLASLNAMRLVPEKDQWFVEYEENVDSDSNDEENELIPVNKRVVTIANIEKQYQAIRARIRVAELDWKQGMLHGGPMTPREIVNSLTSTGLYYEAIRLSRLFEMSLHSIFESLTVRCVELSASNGQEARSNEENLLLEALNEVNNRTTFEDYSVCDLAWLLLRLLLEKYDVASENDAGWLGVTVAKQLHSSGWSGLPAWLIISLKAKRPAALLRLFYENDSLEQATNLACELLERSTVEVCNLKNDLYRSNHLWTPLTLINRLIEALKYLSPEYQECKEMLSQLEEHVGKYYRQVDIASQHHQSMDVRT